MSVLLLSVNVDVSFDSVYPGHATRSAVKSTDDSTVINLESCYGNRPRSTWLITFFHYARQRSALMFGFGNKKDKLQAKYNKLMQESYELSTVNRKKSDQKRAEAEEIERKLDELEKQA